MQRRFMTVVGSIGSDGALDLRPSHLVVVDEELTPGAQAPSPEGTVAVEMLAEDLTPIARYQLPVGAICEDGQPTEQLVVIGKVPYMDETRAVRFYRNDKLIGEKRVSGNKPKVSFTWRPGKEVSGVQTVSWIAEDRGVGQLHYVLAYRDRVDRQWIPLTLPLTTTEYDVDFGALPPGRTRLGLSATADFDSVFVRSQPFSVVAIWS